jgi:hypothetical protein
MSNMIVTCRPNARWQGKSRSAKFKFKTDRNVLIGHFVEIIATSKYVIATEDTMYEQDLCVFTSQPPQKSWFDNQRQSAKLPRRLALHHSCVPSCHTVY